MRPYGWRHPSPSSCSSNGCGTAIATPLVADLGGRSLFLTLLDRVRAVLAAILALSMDVRMPLVSRDVEAFSTGEAAAMTGLREAACRSRLHRARLAVRAAVERHVASEERR